MRGLTWLVDRNRLRFCWVWYIYINTARTLTASGRGQGCAASNSTLRRALSSTLIRTPLVPKSKPRPQGAASADRIMVTRASRGRCRSRTGAARAAAVHAAALGVARRRSSHTAAPRRRRIGLDIDIGDPACGWVRSMVSVFGSIELCGECTLMSVTSSYQQQAGSSTPPAAV